MSLRKGFLIFDTITLVLKLFLLYQDCTGRWRSTRTKGRKLRAVFMAATIYPKYPPFLTSDQSEYLLANIKDWSILNGLAVRPSPVFIPKDVDASGSLAVTAPVTLFPSLFPRSCFEEARAIQIEYNELYALIAGDEGWLREIVEE